MDKFMAGKTDLCCISLRAASGLNLQRATCVVFGELDWSPAVHSQAEDRAHRIGQQKKVQVIRLVTGESIEEQVVELGSRKKALFERLITPGESVISALTAQDIRALFD